MRFQSYFNTAILLIRQYNGSVPLVHFLKQHFAKYKKYGSKDRRHITHLCYSYFRLGHALPKLATEERLKIVLFLCNSVVGDWPLLFDEKWIEHWSIDLHQRLKFIQSIYPLFSVNAIFTWHTELSDGIDINEFAISHLIQPDLFLRIRPGHDKPVLKKLGDAQIQFKQLTNHCLALRNSSKIDALLDIDREVVIQDYNSQRIANFFPLITDSLTPSTSVWDCCAASGGKSILAYDHFPKMDLTVSDIRPNILKNLEKRFQIAGIKKYKSFLSDLSQFSIPNSQFQFILCDAPCSGSGTWSRTPEQLYFFSEEKIKMYVDLQKKILRNVIPKLVLGGYLLYITCSVFKKENEEAIHMMEETFSLQLVKSELLKGYSTKADSMFVALFIKSK